MSMVGKRLGFIFGYIRMNLASAMEYRASFITQVFGMILNDAVWVAFWWLFFRRFPVLQGWVYRDVLMLWAVLAGGFGIATGLFGNALRLAGIIVRGELDHFLILPKNVLLHVLVSRSNVSAWGDIAFSLFVFFMAGPVTLVQCALFIYGIVLVAVILLSFSVIAGSLAFFLGNAEGLSGELINALITFAGYPTAIFRGAAKLILFSVIPAGIISSIPVRLIRSFTPVFFAGSTGFALALSLLAAAVFNRGLRRYESGNLMGIQM